MEIEKSLAVVQGRLGLPRLAGLLLVATTVSVMLSVMVPVTEASVGDQSDVFRNCVRHLEETVCKNGTRVLEMERRKSVAMTLTMWDCLDECRYHCMWAAVREFERVYQDSVPQFYGKWPFVRFLGMQEPASALFSLLNGLSFFVVCRKFRRKVPTTAPTFYIWNIYALVSMNAWFWSTIFHTRDKPITEMLDYFCATAGVLYSFFGLCARILWGQSKLLLAACGAVCVALFANHVYYLAFINFDYGYNMRASIAIGLINSVGWLAWSATCYRRQPYVWKCCAVVLSVNALLLLELGDFPPLWWTLDAHALWHLGTIPLPLLWFSFLTDDCIYMLKTHHLD